jgi:hypothetical protein
MMRVAADRWRSLNPDQHVNAFPEIGIRPMQGEDYGGSRGQLGGRQIHKPLALFRQLLQG